MSEQSVIMTAQCNEIQSARENIIKIRDTLIYEEQRLEKLKSQITEQTSLLIKLKKDQKDAEDHLLVVYHKYCNVFLIDLPTDVLKIIVNYCNYSCGHNIGKLACVNRKFRNLVNLLRINYYVSFERDPVLAPDWLSKSKMPSCQNVVIKTWYCSDSFIYTLRHFLANNVKPDTFLNLSASKHDIQFEYRRRSGHTFVERMTFMYSKFDQNVLSFFNPTIVRIQKLEELSEYQSYIKNLPVSQFTVIVADCNNGKIVFNHINITVDREIGKSKLKALKLFPQMPIIRNYQ